MTRRRWIADRWDSPAAPGRSAFLEGAPAEHLARGLRARPGMMYDLVADARVWHAEIESVGESSVIFRLLSELESPDALDLTVVLGIFKFDRLEWAVEKLTELGVSAIRPAVARRTEKHLGQAAVKRIERWRRIAREAAQQSRRSAVPEVADPLPLQEVLALAANGSSPARFVLAENEMRRSLVAALEASSSSSHDDRGTWLAVGPEGGWTSDEEALFARHAWTPVTLGSTILRAETAAIAGVAIAAAWMHG